MSKYICILILLSPLFGYSHQNPPGENYPNVFTIENCFHVLFEEVVQTDENENGYRIDLFKKVFSSEGNIEGERIQLKKYEYTKYFDIFDLMELEEEHQGPYKRFGDEFYIFSDYRRKHKGKPFYHIASKNNYIEKKLDWDKFSIDIVEGFEVTEDSIVVVATTGTGDEMYKPVEEIELWMFHFDKSSGKLISAKKVGDPTFIYSFPGVSNLILDRGIVYFVWNQDAVVEGDPFRLHLVSYDIVRRQYVDKALPYKSTWNISISINSNEKYLGMAYHGISHELAVEFIPIKTEQVAGGDRTR